MTQRLNGSIDGIQLARFAPGFVYDVGTSLASYLLASNLAEPVADDVPALVLPVQQRLFGPLPSEHGSRLFRRAEAPDDGSQS